MINRVRQILIPAFFIFILTGCHASHPDSRGEEDKGQSHVNSHNGGEIVSGSFKGLAIGQSYAEAFNSLSAMGARGAIPLPSKIEARTKLELDNLKESRAVRFGPGSAQFVFEGDRVIDRLVGYDLPQHEIARKLESRAEVFDWLSKYVGPTPGTIVTSFDPEASPISFDGHHPLDFRKISKFVMWEAEFKDEEGYWGVHLLFDQGRLKRIQTRFSSVEPL